MRTTPTPTELTDEAARWLVDGGIVVMALFPLALPIIALTLVAGLPLLLIAVAVGLPAALVTAPILVARRGLRARRPNPGSDRDRLVPARTDALGRSTPLTSQGGGR